MQRLNTKISENELPTSSIEPRTASSVESDDDAIHAVANASAVDDGPANDQPIMLTDYDESHYQPTSNSNDNFTFTSSDKSTSSREREAQTHPYSERSRSGSSDSLIEDAREERQ